MSRQRNAIPAKRLRHAEGLYEHARNLLGDDRADRMAQFITGAAVQLDWKTGVLVGEDDPSAWAKYAGDPAARGWRRFMARFWQNGHVLTTEYDELNALRHNLARTYGAECVSLALAYRAHEHDEAVHIGTVRPWQEQGVMADSNHVAAFSREGPEPAELSWGVAVDLPERRVFMSVATQAAGRIAAAQCMAQGTAGV